MEDLAFRSATDVAERIRRREIGSLEAVDYFVDRIERLDGSVNAAVVRDFDRARDAAREADNAAEPVGPLHGVPVTVKEGYHVAGLPTTFGYPALVDNTPDWDADCVARYKAAGAVLLGKTNMAYAGADFQTYNEVYGTTSNPWDLERIPGGSSGGSSAALAAGLTPLEVGSDIGGSIRNPAHFCGVYGHKPTFGIVSQAGHSTMLSPGPATDLVVCGPMARSAADLSLALDILVGPSSLDAAGWRLDLPHPTKTRLRDYRVAVWADDANAPVDCEIAERAASIGETLAKLGARVSDSARPAIDARRGYETYLELLHSVMAAGVGRGEYEKNQRYAAATDPEDRSDRAIMSRSMVLSHAGWLGANGRREALRHAWREFFEDWDILICPQMAVTAFPHDHAPFNTRTVLVNGEEQPYFQQLFWSGLVTAPYLPSTVFPAGLSNEGLPIGLQAVGSAYHDHVPIDFSRLLAKEIGGFRIPPGYE